MRLINCSRLELEEFFGADTPPFAILSHTWEDEEVTFQDFAQPYRSSMRGWGKIYQTCRLAIMHGLQYAWVDTCCIDKTSSAELTEAINSMYQWYARSIVCYAFLSDLNTTSLPPPPERDNGCVSPEVRARLATCRWFTRGWTLQELIAPARLLFFDREWKQYGSKSQLVKEISSITTIDEVILGASHTWLPKHIRAQPACRKMYWAASRQTKRAEDMAYCLVGLFEVNMPMLYGEGGKRAFERLQEEIIKVSNDFSLFAWEIDATAFYDEGRGLLASSPIDFARSGTLVLSQSTRFNPEFSMTNKGLRINARLRGAAGRAGWLSLHCHDPVRANSPMGIFLQIVQGNTYVRGNCRLMEETSEPLTPAGDHLYIATHTSTIYGGRLHLTDIHMFHISNDLPSDTYKAVGHEPRERWDPRGHTFTTDDLVKFCGFCFLQGLGALKHQKLLVAFGFEQGKKPWICVVSEPVNPKMWAAAENCDPQLVGNQRTGLEPSVLHIDKVTDFSRTPAIGHVYIPFRTVTVGFKRTEEEWFLHGTIQGR